MRPRPPLESPPSTVYSYFGFDSAFLQKLERLALLSRRPIPGPSAGARRSPRHGSSVEFADFRDYSAGDDFRRIDWNAYARLDRLFLRLYSAEETTTLTLFLDHSASMDFGAPSKAHTAARLAAILSFIALHKYDQVALLGWGKKIDHYLPAQSGKGAVPRVWRSIVDIANGEAADGTDFTALRDFNSYCRGRGLAVVLSDFLSPSDWRAGLRGLQGAGQEVSVIQILAPEELQPSLRGDWKLRDAETGREVEVTISPRALRRYLDALAAHTAALGDFCRHHGMAFVQLSSDASLEDTALTGLQGAGVVT